MASKNALPDDPEVGECSHGPDLAKSPSCSPPCEHLAPEALAKSLTECGFLHTKTRPIFKQGCFPASDLVDFIEVYSIKPLRTLTQTEDLAHSVEVKRLLPIQQEAITTIAEVLETFDCAELAVPDPDGPLVDALPRISTALSKLLFFGFGLFDAVMCHVVTTPDDPAYAIFAQAAHITLGHTKWDTTHKTCVIYVNLVAATTTATASAFTNGKFVANLLHEFAHAFLCLSCLSCWRRFDQIGQGHGLAWEHLVTAIHDVFEHLFQVDVPLALFPSMWMEIEAQRADMPDEELRSYIGSSRGGGVADVFAYIDSREQEQRQQQQRQQRQSRMAHQSQSIPQQECCGSPEPRMGFQMHEPPTGSRPLQNAYANGYAAPQHTTSYPDPMAAMNMSGFRPTQPPLPPPNQTLMRPLADVPLLPYPSTALRHAPPPLPLPPGWPVAGMGMGTGMGTTASSVASADVEKSAPAKTEAKAKTSRLCFAC